MGQDEFCGKSMALHFLQKQGVGTHTHELFNEGRVTKHPHSLEPLGHPFGYRKVEDGNTVFMEKSAQPTSGVLKMCACEVNFAQRDWTHKTKNKVLARRHIML